MCGRFSLTASPEEVADHFSLVDLDSFPERYNIAPTQPIMAIVGDSMFQKRHDQGELTQEALHQKGSNLPDRRALLVRWGFMPSWVKDFKDFPLLINARSETAIGKASFKTAMRHRRVLIPASGFYEWHRPSKDKNNKSQAYWLRPKHGKIVAFAGLMETYSSADGSEIDTAAILTSAANKALSPIHHRMPIIINPEDFTKWLDCKTREPRHVSYMMKPANDDLFEIIAVSDDVNKVANVGPELQRELTCEQLAFAQTPQSKPEKTKAGKMSKSSQMDLF